MRGICADGKINRERLKDEYPRIMTCIEQLGMGFIFNYCEDCKLYMVCDFLSNWFPNKRENDVKVCGKNLHFDVMSLNTFLGTPNVNHIGLWVLFSPPPDHVIRHTLYNSSSMEKWT